MSIPQTRLKNLYFKEKLSTAEVARFFKCSERTINYWLSRYGLKKRSISEAVYLKYNPNGDPFKVIEKPRNIDEAILYGLGLGLFWGEGNKKNKNAVRLGNTDPRLIKRFLDFLIKILGVNKSRFKFGLQTFSDINTDVALKFWLNELKEFDINKNQFFKVIITKSGSIGNYKEKSKYGVLTVHFGNTKLKKILDNMLASVAQRQSNSMVNNFAHFDGNIRVNPELLVKA